MFSYMCILFVYNFLLTNQNPVSTNISVTSDTIPINQTREFKNNNESSIARNLDKLANDSTNIKFNDFRPSQQVASGYEFTFSGNQESRSKTIDSYLPNWTGNTWTENPKRYEQSSLEEPWKSTKIKFPPTTIDRPYEFKNNFENHLKPQVPSKLNYGQPPIVPMRPVQSTESMWQKFMILTGLENQQPVSSQKSFYGNSISEHSPQYGHYEQPKEYHQSVPYPGSAMSPFKKILKVLATIIPIGLFLSALTPTIITVSSVNDTITRHNRKAKEDIMEKVATSLNVLEKLHKDQCEQKVFCELMVNSMFSKNAEEHVINLLNNFVKRERMKDESQFMKILEAVKNLDCSPISCKHLKGPT